MACVKFLAMSFLLASRHSSGARSEDNTSSSVRSSGKRAVGVAAHGGFIKRLQARTRRRTRSAASAGPSEKKFDMVFVIDGSRRVSRDDFAAEIDFVSAAATAFAKDSAEVTATVVQVASEVETSCEDSKIVDGKKEFETCVKDLEQLGGYARLDVALKKVSKRDVAEGHEQVVIITLGGHVFFHWDEALESALEIKKKGGTIFVATAENTADLEQLQSLSSGEHFWLKLKEMEQFPNLIDPMFELISSAEAHEPEGENKQSETQEGKDADEVKLAGLKRELEEETVKVNALAKEVAQLANLESSHVNKKFKKRGKEKKAWLTKVNRIEAMKPRDSRCGNGCLQQAMFGLEEVKGGPQVGGMLDMSDTLEMAMGLGYALTDAENSVVRSNFHDLALAVMNEISKVLQTEADALPRQLKDEIWQLKTEKEIIEFALKERNPSEFANLLSDIFIQGATLAKTDEALLCAAEYEGFYNEGLLASDSLGNDKLDQLRGSLAKRMKTEVKLANHIMEHFPFIRYTMSFSDAWQEAWGKVRVYTKVTTQCSVVVPKGQEPNHFMAERKMQKYWGTCRGATPFSKDEFPTAIATCDRIKTLKGGKEDAAEMKKNALSVDRMVRFLGCGANRPKVEPRIDYDGPRTMCHQTEFGNSLEGGGNKKFYNALCSDRSMGDKKCQMYGPFWGIYAAKLDHVYGVKSEVETADKGEVYTEPCHMGYDKEKCGAPQIEGFKGMVNEAPAQYIYGSLPGLPMSIASGYRHSKPPKTWDPATMDWPLPYKRIRSPPMSHTLSEVRRGSSILMMAYGYSGAGKTTTLLGSGNVQGIVSLHLSKFAKQITDLHLQCIEVYGRINPETGKFVPKTGQGLWVFPWGANSVSAEYVGPWDSFVTDGAMDFEKVKALLKEKNPRTSLREVRHNDVMGDWQYDQDVKEILKWTEDVRKRDDAFQKDGQELSMAHIRATPNNPTSSRGTLIVMMDLFFKDGGEGSIVVVDLAGAEDPVTMIGGFMKVLKEKPKPSTAPTWEAKTQREKAKTACKMDPDKIILKYLHQMGNPDYLDGDIAECLEFRDFLTPCERGITGCQEIKLYGKTAYYKPDLQADLNFIRKSDRPEDLVVRDQEFLNDLKSQKTVLITQRFKDFVFNYTFEKDTGAPQEVEKTFTVEEVLAARMATQPKLNDKKHSPKKALLKTKDMGCGWKRRLPDDPVVAEYLADFINPAEFKRRPCPMQRCRNWKQVVDGKVKNLFLDTQLDRVHTDLIKGGATGKSWIPNLCAKTLKDDKGQETCDETAKWDPKELMKFGSPCRWPDGLVDVPDAKDAMVKFAKAWGVHGAIKRAGTIHGDVRSELYMQVQAYLDEFKKHEEKLRTVWDVHMSYFTQVIMPMVQEALYINEMLNQMRKYLEQVSAWGANAKKDPWPYDQKFANLPVAEKEERQAIDMTVGSDYERNGYSSKGLIQPTDLNNTYYENFCKLDEKGAAIDRIMGMTLFEYMRRKSLARENGNFRILFGTFIRADKPNGDPDCAGAKLSLDFSQKMINDAGGRTLTDEMKKFISR